VHPHEPLAAEGRFFYTPASAGESINSRIHNYTRQYLEHYKLNPTIDEITLSQTRLDGQELHEIEVGSPGQKVSLLYFGTAQGNKTKPLWRVIQADSSGRTESDISMQFGLQVEVTRFNRQGKRTSLEMTTDVRPVWNAVEIILGHPLTHDNITKKMHSRYFVSAGAAVTNIAQGKSLIEGDPQPGDRFVYDCPLSPAEARQTLTSLFEGSIKQESLAKYNEGKFHIVQLQRYDSPEAIFYGYVELLAERAGSEYDHSPRS